VNTCSKWAVRVLGVLGIGIAVIVIAVVAAIHHYGRDLPDYTVLKNYEPAVVTRAFAADGRLIGEFATEKRIFAPIDSMPKLLIGAFLAAEDQRFYSHNGVDLRGLARAAWKNIGNLGSAKRPVGGSTITQQVAKNFLLNNEISYERKIKELILSYRIERAYSKDHILEIYLNGIFLGNNAYGVAAASLAYFDKAMSELTIAEIAFLGGLPQAPSRFHPTRNHNEAKRRRDHVLLRMRNDGYITQDQYEEAQASEIKLAPRTKNPSLGAEYFVEEIRRELELKYGDKTLLTGGLVVRSSLDPALQQMADRALRAGLVAYDRRHGWRGPIANIAVEKDWTLGLAELPLPNGRGNWPVAIVLKVDARHVEIGLQNGKSGTIPMAELKWARPWQKDQTVGAEPKKPSDVLKVGDVVLVEQLVKTAAGTPPPADQYSLRQIPDVNGAIVAMDPHTGRILAMTGGFSFWISQFNNATQAKRQPGSAFKPFVYLAGLENGYTPSTIIVDEPFAMDVVGWGKYEPRNYAKDFTGPTTIRRALELSRNVVTVKLAQRIGIDKIAEIGRRFDISDNIPLEPSIALGAAETTPLRLTAAYAMLVNGGKKIAPTLIDRIQDRHGKTIYRHDDRKCVGCLADWSQSTIAPKLRDDRAQIVDPRNAYQIVSMLEGVVRRGTGAIVGASIKQAIAGKTGTTNETVDTWFVGFTPDLVVGVWVGFDMPRTLGAREQGGTTAAPIFRDFMLEALKLKPSGPFKKPDGLIALAVNLDTGLPAVAGDPRAIVDLFTPQTVPSPQGAHGPDGVQSAALASHDPDAPAATDGQLLLSNGSNFPAAKSDHGLRFPAQSHDNHENKPPVGNCRNEVVLVWVGDGYEHQYKRRCH